MKDRLFRSLALAGIAAAGLAAASGCVIRRTAPVYATPTVVAPPPPTTVVAAPAPVAVAPPPAVVSPPAVITGSTLAPTGAVATGAIGYPSQRVRYPIGITYARTVSIYVEGHGLDPTVAVYDQYGNRLGFDDDGGSGLDSSLILTLVPGSYVVEVGSYGSSTGPFTLTVN